MGLKMFIGSSTEAKNYAKALKTIIQREGHEVLLWSDAFPAGATFIEALEKSVTWSDSALFIASADDFGVSRGKKSRTPRDNVLFEYGFFASRHGRGRVALATLENETPKLPSDLSGVTHLLLQTPQPQTTFPKLNGKTIRDWLDGITRSPAPASPPTERPYRPVTVTAGNIPALLTNEIVPRIKHAREIDLLSMYRNIDVHRYLDAFRVVRRNRLRACYLDAWDAELVSIYQRKFGPDRDQAYMKDAVFASAKQLIGPATLDPKRQMVKPRKAPVANYDLRVSGLRITYDYCRVDGMALVIPLDMKLEQNPPPPGWLITRDEHPELFNFYLADFSDVFKNARSIYASRRSKKK